MLVPNDRGMGKTVRGKRRQKTPVSFSPRNLRSNARRQASDDAANQNGGSANPVSVSAANTTAPTVSMTTIFASSSAAVTTASSVGITTTAVPSGATTSTTTANRGPIMSAGVPIRNRFASFSSSRRRRKRTQKERQTARKKIARRRRESQKTPSRSLNEPFEDEEASDASIDPANVNSPMKPVSPRRTSERVRKRTRESWENEELNILSDSDERPPPRRRRRKISLEREDDEAEKQIRQCKKALQIRGQIAKLILQVKDMVHHVDGLERHDKDPTSFLVDIQAVLYEIRQKLPPLLEKYNDYIGIYPEFSQQHSDEVLALTQIMDEVISAKLGELHQIWSCTRPYIGSIMDINMSLSSRDDRPEGNQTRTASEQQTHVRNLTDDFSRIHLADRRETSVHSTPVRPRFDQGTGSFNPDTGISRAENFPNHGTRSTDQSHESDLASRAALLHREMLYDGVKPSDVSRIEMAGKGEPLEIHGSLFADYVRKEVFVTCSQFDGTPESPVSLFTILSKLQAIHVASNIPYHRKMLALCLGLSGNALSAILPYTVEPDEFKYKRALCKLYKLYGDDCTHQANTWNVLNRDTIPNSSLDTQVEYLSKAESAIETLLHSGIKPDVVYTQACEALMRIMPDRISESRGLRVGQFGYHVPDRTYFYSNPEKHFKQFVNWMYSQRNSEQALRGTANLENQSSGLRNEFQTMKEKLESFEKDRKKMQEYTSQQAALRNKIKELEQQRLPASARTAEAEPRSPRPRNNRGSQRGNRKPDLKRPCPFCGSEEHTMYNCSKTIEERLAIVQEKELCKVCLRPGHSKAECRTPIKCYACYNKFNKDEERARHSPGTCIINAQSWKQKIESQKKRREERRAPRPQEPENSADTASTSGASSSGATSSTPVTSA